MASIDSNDSVTVRVPMTFRKRGGRKQVIAPDGQPSWAPPRARIDNTMVKALARTFRWRRMLETGRYATIDELARAEKINASYVSRALQLTLLAPEIVEAILDGRQAAEVTLPRLMGPFPAEWERQFSAAFVRWLMRPASNSATAAICAIRRFATGPTGIAGRSQNVTPPSPESAADRDILAPKARSHPRRDVSVGSGATRTKVLPKFSPRSISAKAVGTASNPSRISSR